MEAKEREMGRRKISEYGRRVHCPKNTGGL